jgi:hypothetical protein
MEGEEGEIKANKGSEKRKTGFLGLIINLKKNIFFLVIYT